MPWLIKAEFQHADGYHVERSERIPAHADVTDELTRAFRAILFQALAEAADDNSDLTLTVAFVGSQDRAAHAPGKGVITAAVRRQKGRVERATDDGSIGTGKYYESAQPCGCDPGEKYTCLQHRGEAVQS
jgi:hypothetical protein